VHRRVLQSLLHSCPTDAVRHFGIDKRACALEGQQFGFFTILEFFERLVTAAGAEKARMVHTHNLFGFWQRLLRVVGSFGDCPCCLAVCPVGDDYYAHLANIQKVIPETTPEKIEKGRAFKRARLAGEPIDGLDGWNIRWVGPDGYRGAVARRFQEFKARQLERTRTAGPGSR